MGTYFQTALGKVIGSKNDRELKRLESRVAEINALEPEMQQLDDDDFPLRTEQLKKRLAEGATLDDLLPEAFALCREAGRRTLNMRHFDVQLIGAMVLHEGKIAEMKTGEGKTLVATLPVYLNALAGKGIQFASVDVPLVFKDRIAQIENARAVGSELGLTANGEVDLGADKLRPDGTIPVPTGPGLGVTLDQAKLERYLFEAKTVV